MKKVLLIILALSIALSCAVGFAACNRNKDDESVITIRNLYFNDWNGEDDYTAMLEEMFDTKFKVSSYSWADWSTQVSSSWQSNSLPNVFQDDIDSYNFANTYLAYVEDGSVKALPDDLSPWPNVKKLVESVADIKHFKVDGKLYGIPVAKNINGNVAEFTPFTYVYRRDWAKELKEQGKLNIEVDDDYTWTEFTALLKAFYDNKCQSGNVYALADVEWGFPSIINFYKDAPHCFTYNSTKTEVVSNYATDNYVNGLKQAKAWVENGYYGYDQFRSNDGDANKVYYGGRIGVFYENLSLTNYTTLRKNIQETSTRRLSKEELDDKTAIMKVSGPDGKYALEGQEDWFSMTFFSSKISDEKMEKILSIMDYLLSEEGTLFGLYGVEGHDYEKVEITADSIQGDDEYSDYNYVWKDGVGIKLLSWTKSEGTNQYVNPYNGARYLRYMCTLGYDIIDKDPLTDTSAYPILKDWEDFMLAQQEAGNLRILKEPAEVKWLSTPTKADRAGGVLEAANKSVQDYLYNSGYTLDQYKNEVSKGTWETMLGEINRALGLK
ncbi:MAG: hypothetical protein IJU10_05190 [Clostridia bacterium]|nr:hypothetical protein [Clostridia bacterium]